MTKLSEYDREELAYLKWELNGGPERKAAKDLAGMDSVLADAENKANLKYEADMETLEKLFDLIYKLKQMEEQNAE